MSCVEESNDNVHIDSESVKNEASVTGCSNDKSSSNTEDQCTSSNTDQCNDIKGDSSNPEDQCNDIKADSSNTEDQCNDIKADSSNTEDQCNDIKVDNSNTEDQCNGTKEGVVQKITFKKPTITSINSTRLDAAKGLAAASKRATDSKDATSEEIQPSKEAPVEKKSFTKSPAERLKEHSIPLPYKEPPWGGLPSSQYSLEVLKNGVIISNLALSTKSYYTVGRLDVCDMTLEHPSISRYHAILQHRVDEESGLYLYDLGSTHGTTLNKLGLIPKTFYRLRVGHVIRFGGSTRMFIVQGPDEDQEEEAKETVTELIKKRKDKLQKLESGETEEEDRERVKEGRKEDEDSGIDWGMGEDADEATDLADNPYAIEANEELYVDDPKKTLRGWFEREGHELQYQVEEKGYAQFLCRVDLPVDVVSSGIVTAEAMVKGKKKEAVIQCALEACRLLDQYGLLRQATHESKKRKKRDWEENDFYDSDEDNFLDRTGAVERKRQSRMMQAGKVKAKAETYDSLKVRLEALEPEIQKTEEALENASKEEKEENESPEGVDALDAYMSSLKSSAPMEKKSKASMKMRLSELRKEESRLKTLLEIAKPAVLPAIKPTKALPMIGSRKGHGSTGLKKVDSSGRSLAASKTKEKEPIEKKKMTISIKGPFIPPEVEAALKEKEQGTEPVQSSGEDRVGEKSPSDVGDENARKQPVGESSECRKQEELSHEEQPSERKEDSSQEEHSNEERNHERVSLDKELGSEKQSIVQDTNSDKSVKPLSEDFVSSKEGTTTKRKRQRQRNRNEEAKRRTQQKYDAYDPNYDVWVPPQNQSGDGRTSLNDKLGY